MILTSLQVSKKHAFGHNPPSPAGAGTLGLEILEQLVDRDSIFSLNAVFTNQKDVEAVIIPVGGGGMIAGVTLAIKAIRPEVAFSA